MHNNLEYKAGYMVITIYNKSIKILTIRDRAGYATWFLHRPSILAIFAEVKVVSRAFEHELRRRFCKTVGHLICGGHKAHLKSSEGDFLTHEMEIDFSVLHVGMENRIGCQVRSS